MASKVIYRGVRWFLDYQGSGELNPARLLMKIQQKINCGYLPRVVAQGQNSMIRESKYSSIQASVFTSHAEDGLNHHVIISVVVTLNVHTATENEYSIQLDNKIASFGSWVKEFLQASRIVRDDDVFSLTQADKTDNKKKSELVFSQD